MILLGLGANLPSVRFGPPRATLEAALAALEAEGVRIVRRSRWYDTAAVPAAEQPRFVNLVVAVETKLDPVALLMLLHRIEKEFGRVRGVRNEARVIDLDLLAYDEVLRPGPEPPILPHPRLSERAFVLLPLRLGDSKGVRQGLPRIATFSFPKRRRTMSTSSSRSATN